MTVIVVSGLYVSQRECLPLVNTEAHTTILDNVSRTKLIQTYINPSEYRHIPELKYNFPLYDGVSVVGFTCRIGTRTIVGQVKEREKAKKDFREAVEKGQKAALLEQNLSASDVFTTTVGNIPAGAKVVIEITYIGELKHDAEVDGIRFTIPTKIMPRYGSYPVELVKGGSKYATGSNIKLTVDVVMAEKSFIKQIQSPSHPIAVSLGTTSLAPNADPVMYKASATLSLDGSGLEKDFIVNVIAKNTGIPTAILETHPTIPGQRALMTTLVPKFSLPPEKPEIVLVCDRSGSMAGSRINLAKSALKVFLKSIPVGAKFNICSFGSSYSFLWKKSQTYSESTLQEALNHVESMEANLGGTEMLNPVKAAIDSRYQDISLEIMLLTDGEIWDQERLFKYLGTQVKQSKGAVRVFTLGIGNGVSHALIEGVAKAGNGFSQSVGEGEKMDSKVVRMLKGALSPHVSDYTLEVKYINDNKSYDSDDDFELVEKVADCLKINTSLGNKTKTKLGSPQIQKVFSLFDTSLDLDKEVPADEDASGESRYSHLPEIETPKLLQTPHNIPPLYAFNRTSVYLLMSPECSQLKPKSVVLKGTSMHGPLELEIPIQILDTPGETIHQLAARKATTELEQGRGWIVEAKSLDNVSIKKKYESKFTEMIEREAVRLGVQFQVQGKWTSFVATETDPDSEKIIDEEAINISYSTTEKTPTSPPAYTSYFKSNNVLTAAAPRSSSWFRRSSGAASQSMGSPSSITTGYANYSSGSPAPNLAGAPLPYPPSGLFGSSSGFVPPPPPPPLSGGFGSPSSTFGGSFSEIGGKSSTNTLESNLNEMEGLLDSIKAKAKTMNVEVNRQNSKLEQIESKTDSLSCAVTGAVKSSKKKSSGFGSVVKRMSFSSGKKDNNGAAPQAYDSAEAFTFLSNTPQAPQAYQISETPRQDGYYVSQQYPQYQQQQQQQQQYQQRYPRQLAEEIPDMSQYEEMDGNTESAAIFAPFVSASASACAPISSCPPLSPPSIPQISAPIERKEYLHGRRPAPTVRPAPFPPPSPTSIPQTSAIPVFGSVQSSAPAIKIPPTKSKLESLIDLQSFEGFWEWNSYLFTLLEIAMEKAMTLIEADKEMNKDLLATAIVIAYFEEKLNKDKDVWELISDKAKTWLEGQVGQLEAESLLEKALALVV
ncbi:hypothetical protein BGZ76_005430 [Entomortierella beljakovae]|nr:hypothetical protein BGZ76_005430 [Entomortierella beljakovae]